MVVINSTLITKLIYLKTNRWCSYIYKLSFKLRIKTHV